MSNEYILIPCTVRRGGFSSEKEFTIDLPGCQYRGLAYQYYVFDSFGKVIGKTDPSEVREEKDWVKGRIVKRLDNGLLLVNLPSGENVELRAEDVKDTMGGEIS